MAATSRWANPLWAGWRRNWSCRGPSKTRYATPLWLMGRKNRPLYPGKPVQIAVVYDSGEEAVNLPPVMFIQIEGRGLCVWRGPRCLGMLSENKQLLLGGFLGRLPERVAARLAKAVEVDRLIGGSDLPHEEILRALRPQLRTVPDKTRTQTPQRFFCRPFEDLLVSPDRSAKQKGRITRSTIEPVWNWLPTHPQGARAPPKHQGFLD